jgi:carbon monoxide dehydrogenase subunit G
VIRIEFTAEISCPPENVFAALADLERLPEWQSSAVSSKPDGPLAVGTRIREQRSMMGREIDNELEVTAYDPPRRFALEGRSGPVPLSIDHELVEDDGKTVLHVHARAEPGALFKLAEPMIARTAEQELRADFERLKDRLEAGGYRSQSAPVD